VREAESKSRPFSCFYYGEFSEKSQVINVV